MMKIPQCASVLTIGQINYCLAERLSDHEYVKPIGKNAEEFHSDFKPQKYSLSSVSIQVDTFLSLSHTRPVALF